MKLPPDIIDTIKRIDKEVKRTESITSETAQRFYPGPIVYLYCNNGLSDLGRHGFEHQHKKG